MRRALFRQTSVLPVKAALVSAVAMLALLVPSRLPQQSLVAMMTLVMMAP